MAVFFNGRKWTSPAVMSKVDDSAMFATNLDGNNIAVFIGRSEGGEPKKALTFSSTSEARETLRSGDLLVAIEQAFDPSAETDGPSKIVGVRVNPAVQATGSIMDSEGIEAIKLTSTDYGKYTNSIRFKIESGTESGKKVTTQLDDDYYSQDNVTRNAFSIAYSGAGAGAITITNSKFTLMKGSMQSTDSGDETTETFVATDTFEIELSDYPTIAELVDKINTYTDFDASVMDNNGDNPAHNGLDALTTQVITGTYTVKADLQAVVDWFNGISEGYVNAERASTGSNPPENTAWTFLTGGTDGTVSNSDWTDCFEMLQTEDVQWITPLSSDASIHAMCSTHCTYMSDAGRKERRCIVGGELGQTDAQAIEKAHSLASDRLSYVHLGMYAYDADGNLTLYPPYILASKIAGMFSGVTPGYSLTNRTVKISGIERNLKNPTDTDALIEGGILCVENRDKGYTITQSISTWLQNTKYNRREVSTGTAVDYVCKTVRSRVEDLIGGEPASPQKLKLALETADTALRELSNENIIVGDDDNPAYRNLTASIDGDFLKMEVEVSPGVPINYIGITVHCVPYSGTATA